MAQVKVDIGSIDCRELTGVVIVERQESPDRSDVSIRPHQTLTHAQMDNGRLLRVGFRLGRADNLDKHVDRENVDQGGFL